VIPAPPLGKNRMDILQIKEKRQYFYEFFERVRNYDHTPIGS
jgi:hypothetical protein